MVRYELRLFKRCHHSRRRREISKVTIKLKDVSLDRPIGLSIATQLDNQPLTIEGKVGPVGREPGKGTIPMDLAIKALNILNVLKAGTASG